MRTLKLKSEEKHVCDVVPSGNWTTAKDFFPVIEVNQKTGKVKMEYQNSSGRQDHASIETTPFPVRLSKDKTQMIITGEVSCKNWRHYELSGTQKYVFCIFVGDSGHIYTHRAPATKGWLECTPDLIKKRLIKLGIGSTEKVLQQGDYLLKPANGKSLPVEEFKHEWTSSSHHKLTEPVLSVYISGTGRIIYIPNGKTLELVHEAVDGIQHPTISVPAGQWIIGTTASQLQHGNKRD